MEKTNAFHSSQFTLIMLNNSYYYHKATSNNSPLGLFVQ